MIKVETTELDKLMYHPGKKVKILLGIILLVVALCVIGVALYHLNDFLTGQWK